MSKTSNKLGRIWSYVGAKKETAKIDERVKEEISKRANDLLERKFKPVHIKTEEQNKDSQFNYIVDLYIKWVRERLYFCAKYRCPFKNAISEYFEVKFARIEFAGSDSFNLSFMRHTGQWFELCQSITLDECF
jgi:hypothetical protein